MASRPLRIPPWLLLLDIIAVLLLAAGAVRLFVPDLEWVAGLPESFAWVCIAAGLACLALFWLFFLRLLRERRAARG
jgi:hypothetical protein